jgi:hypothetical protein
MHTAVTLYSVVGIAADIKHVTLSAGVYIHCMACSRAATSVPAEIVEAGMHAPSEIDAQPTHLHSWSNFWYFVAYIVVVSYTLLNLYIGEGSLYVMCVVLQTSVWCVPYLMCPLSRARHKVSVARQLSTWTPLQAAA